VNDDGGITPGDAQLAFQYYLYCASLQPDYVQYCAADFCGTGDIAACDGSVTPGDALAILRSYLSYPDPCAKMAADGLSIERVRIVPLISEHPEIVEFAITALADGDRLPAFGLDVQFDSPRLTLLDVLPALGGAPWLLFGGTEVSAGVARIGGVALSPVAPGADEVPLAILRFGVNGSVTVTDGGRDAVRVIAVADSPEAAVTGGA